MSALRPVLTGLTVLLLALLATPVLAQSIPEVEIDRPADELPDALGPDPIDPDRLDSVLVFTSTGNPAAVRCTANDGNGDPIGSAVTVPLPADGLRWIRASDLSDGADFVGSAHCTSLGKAAGSAFLVGPRGATDLPAHRTRKRGSGRRYVHHLHFPVAASY